MAEVLDCRLSLGNRLLRRHLPALGDGEHHLLVVRSLLDEVAVLDWFVQVQSRYDQVSVLDADVLHIPDEDASCPALSPAVVVVVVVGQGGLPLVDSAAVGQGADYYVALVGTIHISKLPVVDDRERITENVGLHLLPGPSVVEVSHRTLGPLPEDLHIGVAVITVGTPFAHGEDGFVVDVAVVLGAAESASDDRIGTEFPDTHLVVRGTAHRTVHLSAS